MTSVLPDLYAFQFKKIKKVSPFFPPTFDRIKAAMCKICVWSASVRVRVCVSPMTAGLIKLLHSNELWLSVSQLL